MPTICMFRGIKIYINWREHQPPHFHAKYGSDEVLVSINDIYPSAHLLISKAQSQITPAVVLPTANSPSTRPDEMPPNQATFSTALPAIHPPARKVEEYTAKGFDTRTAEYLAAGRRNIVAVSAEENFALRLTFDNGEVRLLDCKPFLQPDTVFAPFMKQENFKRVYLDDCNCVAWDIDPNVDSDVVWSNKVDLCSDTCYLDSVPIQ